MAAHTLPGCLVEAHFGKPNISGPVGDKCNAANTAPALFRRKKFKTVFETKRICKVIPLIKRAYDCVFDLPDAMTDRTIYIYSDETDEDRPFTLVFTQEPVDPVLSEENQIKKAMALLIESFPEFAMSWAQWMEVEHGRTYMCEFSWRSERGPMTQCQVYFPGQKHVLCATFSRLGPFTDPDKEAVLRFMHSYRLMPE